jgi:hypothetical protein
LAALDRELDDRRRADRDYIIADMNGSAVFLLAALKMRLGLAARRCGVGAEAPVDVLLRAMGLPEDVREAAWAVRRRRDGAGRGLAARSPRHIATEMSRSAARFHSGGANAANFPGRWGHGTCCDHRRS